jgi:hypothetical protein
MWADLEKLKRCSRPMGALAYDSESSSDASQHTQQTDARVTGGNSSQNVSGTGNTISVSSTDAGATKSALNLAALTSVLAIDSANQAQQLAVQSAESTAATTKALFDTGVKANQQSLQLVSHSYGDALNQTAGAFQYALSGLDKAYETAKAGDQREVSMFVTVAIALTVGVTLAAIFGKKKG